MRAGIVILPEYRWADAKRRWCAAEVYGFDHAWTFDHLGWRSLVDGPWFGAVPTLTAAAAATTRIRLGTLVASPNIRHPVPFARELTALDDISDGRFILGVGSGSDGDYDSRVFGVRERLSGRTRRFAEFVELLDALLTTDRVSWKGEFYEALEARRAPGCVQQPRLPFVVAADGPRAMAVAARFGQGWITMGTRAAPGLDEWWSSVAAAAYRFDDVLAADGRDRGEVQRFLQFDSAPVYALSSVECYRDFLARADELGFTDIVAPWPRVDGVFAGREEVLEDIAAQVLANLS